MKGEIWLPVPGYEGRYEVSDLGRVRGLDRIGVRGQRLKGRILQSATNRHGYLLVSLCDGKPTIAKIHRLVLEAFVGRCPEGMETAHNDGKRSNNRLTNLRWDTRAGNHADKIKHGTSARGERHGNARLIETDIERMFDLRSVGYTQQKIANEMGIGRQHVSDILSGKRWAHLTNDRSVA